MTVCIWVAPEQRSDAYDPFFPSIASKSVGGFANGWGLYLGLTNDRFGFQSSNDRYVEASGIRLGNWNHICATWDEDNDEIELFLNGIPALAVFDVGVSDPLRDDSAANILIGFADTNEWPLAGRVDEFKLYQIKLSAAEIYDVYSGDEFFNRADELVTYFDFQADPPGMASDLSGFGNDGTLLNMIAENVVGTPQGLGLDFDGLDDRVRVSANPSIDNLESMTACVWTFWRTPIIELDPIYPILVSKASNGFGGGWELYQFGPTLVGFRANGTRYADASGLVQDEWNHICATFDLPSDEIHLFANGEELSLRADAGVSNDDDDSTSDLYLGFVSTHEWPLNGTLDEFRLYRYAMTPEQISILFDYDR